MELSEEMIEQLKADLSKAKNYGDLIGKDGAIKKLIAKSLEKMLESELTDHLGDAKYSPEGKNSGNSRNGKTHKALKNDNGEIEITVPRNRNGNFDPIIVKKYDITLGQIEDKIIQREWQFETYSYMFKRCTVYIYRLHCYQTLRIK